MKHYDAIVIGSGQAGSPLSHKLADQGWKVALVEKDHLGGSCVNYGCTPTKTMVASARIAHYARRAAEFGVHTGEVAINLPEIVDRKNKIVAQWRGGQERNVAKRPTLDLFRGHGRFVDARTISVNGEQLQADRIFINTGTRPRVPPIPGLDDVEYLTNRNVMDVTELPEHLIVLGGSYIGLEFGQMFRRFGSRVTVIEALDQLIVREDADVAEALQTALESEGMLFRLGSRAASVARTDGGIAVTLSLPEGGTETLTGSHLLVAIGRVPNSDDLGLDAAGISSDAGGYITVNDRLETNVSGIWAMGDVKGGPAFTHIAYDDFMVIFDKLIHGKDGSIAGRLVPYALFTDPELGRVGLTETQARKAGFNLKIGKIPMSHVARAIERDETAGLMKVVIDADTDRILGAAILGSEGGELVQILMALMMADAPWTLFEKSVYIHPTLAEGFFTLMDSVKAVE